MTNITLKSPAKLNLFLHITGKRLDGYHELQTIFQLIDAHDSLTFEVNKTNTITLDISASEDLTTHIEDNLIYRAAALLQKKAHSSTDFESTKSKQTRYGCHITLKKNLPTGGGIGGGSSNAATTLLALNKLWQLNLSLNELAEAGQTLGADVPVFVLGETAWAEGVGEKLTPCNVSSVLNTHQYIVVLKPAVHASTAELFRHPKLERNTSHITLKAALDQPQSLTNAFEPVVTDLYPKIAKALEYLHTFQKQNAINQSLTPRLTGSGACVFAIFDNKEAARSCLSGAPCDGFICQPLQTSPIHDTLSY